MYKQKEERTMKKRMLAVTLSAAMAVSMGVVTVPVYAEEGEPYKAALLLNGTLGDKSFFDSANEGLTELQEELGEDVFTFKVEQMGATSADEAKWEPTLYDYCDDGSYDVIIVGTYQMLDALTNAAADYPDQKFIYFDESFDFENGGENVYNVMYKQNEVSYLVGAAAAMMTTDESLEKIDPSNKIIGFLGGMENSVIKDFLVGYIQGAKDVDEEIQVALAYVGNFYDSAAGKDMALTQYQNGADVGFNVAGSAGLGQIEAAKDADKYAFGVDSDQASLLPDYADNIPTSALKNVGNSLIRAIKLDMEDSLEYGQLEYLGFAEGGVELLQDEHYEEIVPEEIRTKVAELQQQITDGEIVVPTALGDNAMSDDEIQALVDSVKVK
jgi:basic membrane protein A